MWGLRQFRLGRFVLGHSVVGHFVGVPEIQFSLSTVFMCFKKKQTRWLNGSTTDCNEPDQRPTV
jgi:hypothetical protein